MDVQQRARPSRHRGVPRQFETFDLIDNLLPNAQLDRPSGAVVSSHLAGKHLRRLTWVCVVGLLPDLP